MVKPNKPKTLRNLENAISRIILDGLVWEKKVTKGSQCGLICVPASLIGKRLKVILIPVDENDSLSVNKELAIVNEDMRARKAELTKAGNRKKKLEEKMNQETIPIPAPAPVQPESDLELEEEDAY